MQYVSISQNGTQAVSLNGGRGTSNNPIQSANIIDIAVGILSSTTLSINWDSAQVIYFLDDTGSIIAYFPALSFNGGPQIQPNFNNQPVPFSGVISMSRLLSGSSDRNSVWAVDAFGTLWACWQVTPGVMSNWFSIKNPADIAV